MNRLTFLLLVLGAVSVNAAEESADFARYGVIVDRSPFGAVAAGDTEVLPSFAERYAYVGSVPGIRTNELLAIIFDTQLNQSEMIGVGGTFGEGGEIKVVKIEADKENPKVIIQKGLDEAPLRLRPPDKIAPAAPTGPAQVNPVVPGQPNDGATRTVVVPARRRIPFRRGQ